MTARTTTEAVLTYSPPTSMPVGRPAPTGRHAKTRCNSMPLAARSFKQSYDV